MKDRKYLNCLMNSSMTSIIVFIVFANIYLGDVKSHVYGSMATGLAIDSSDMDILVTGLK
jgi:predicted nucleotidyltransferase